MCGLAGLFLPRNAAPLAADIPAMLHAMRHRGPDGTGIYRSPDARFQAGFARLAIIDLATSDQPLVDPGRDQVLLGNGEVYNYLEQRTRLEKLGHVFRTKGDMEVALKSLQHWGLDGLSDLNGMYGLAWYQGGDHRLTLVRDRLGIKPLYWTRLETGGILFASEIKALAASGLVRPEVDESLIPSWLLHGYVPGPATLYRGIWKLEPGGWLAVEADGTIRQGRYWHPRPAPFEGDAARHLSDLLADSVRLQLQADVPLGILLSGGLDSGLITAMAAQASQTPLHTFTVRFGGAGYDESPLADQMARRFGTRHTLIDVGSNDILPHLADLVWALDEPMIDAALLPNYLICRELGKSIRVALNGTGGDELFAGYGRYFPLPVERRWLSLPGWLRGVLRPLAGTMRGWQLARAEQLETDPGAYLAGHCTQYPDPWRRRLGQGGRVSAAQSAFAQGFDGPRQTRMLAADLQTYLPEDLLLLLDRTSMAASVEGRVPFLDHRLVEAALAVPPSIRTPGGRQKGLERQMAGPWLPEDVLNAPKQGFASPVPVWMQGDLGRLAARILTGRTALARGWFQPAGIRALLADPARHAFRLYGLLMLELTVRQHCDHAGQGPMGLEDLCHD